MSASRTPVHFPARNSVYSILAVFSTAVSIFVVYRLAAASLGVGSLGILSVTFSVLSLISVADLGLPLVMTREVARMRSVDDPRLIRRLIVSSALYSLVVTFLLAFIVVSGIEWTIEVLVLKGEEDISRRFMISSAIVASLTSVSAVFTGALEGLERYDLKLISVVSGNLTLIVVAYGMAAGGWSVEGLAYSFAVQGAFLTIAAAASVMSCLRGKQARLTDQSSPSVFVLLSRSARIGVPLRLAGLATFFFEPITRLVIGVFGGASSVGIYELVSRLCIQTQTLISGALQVTVPRLAVLGVASAGGFRSMFVSASKLSATAALLGLGAILSAAAPASILLLSRVDSDFIVLLAALGVAWMFHVLAAPTYFANIADGSVRWNWISQWLAVAVSALVGPVLGMVFGWQAVVAGPIAGLVAATVAAVLARGRRTGEVILHVSVRDAALPIGIGVVLPVCQLIGGRMLGVEQARWLYFGLLLLYCILAMILAVAAIRPLLAANALPPGSRTGDN